MFDIVHVGENEVFGEIEVPLRMNCYNNTASYNYIASTYVQDYCIMPLLYSHAPILANYLLT